MNKIKTIKTKANTENGIINKITKRYSSIKFIRSSPGRTASPQPVSTGSYDMTGRDSEDLKREIGAPVLISKTTLDTDTTDCCTSAAGVQLRNGKIPQEHQQNNRPTSIPDLGEIKFSFLPVEDSNENNIICNATNASYDLSPPLYAKNRSKSASNLHKSEIKVFLQRAPSLELDKKLNGNVEGSYDMPRRLQQYKTHFADSNLSCNKLSPNGDKLANTNDDERCEQIYDRKHDRSR